MIYCPREETATTWAREMGSGDHMACRNDVPEKSVVISWAHNKRGNRFLMVRVRDCLITGFLFLFEMLKCAIEYS